MTDCKQVGQVAAVERDADLRQTQPRPLPEQTLVQEAQSLTDDARALATREAANRARGNCLGGVTLDRLYWCTGVFFLGLWALLAVTSRKQRPATTPDPAPQARSQQHRGQPTLRPPVPSHDNLFLAYQTLASRRSSYDLMLWQTPALAIAAQAFLFTLVLGPGTTAMARLIASGLALVLAVMSMQLMAKHRYHEELDSLLLKSFEDNLGLTEWLGASPHGTGEERIRDEDRDKIPRFPRPAKFWGMSSYRVWFYALSLFAVASALVVLVVLADAAARLLGNS